MKIFTRLNDVSEPFHNAVVTVGNFDGVHLGHRALFQRAIEKAKTQEGTSVVVTFVPHTSHVVRPRVSVPLINTYDQKIDLIQETGIDVLLFVPFTQEFATTSPNYFVKEVLCRTIGMKTILVGPNHTFGKDGKGDTGLLRKMGVIHGFEVIVSDRIQDGARDISSTTIRKLLAKGKVKKAAALMGRCYQLRGKVVHGYDRGGKLLGIPTANVAIGEQVCPESGVYVVTVGCNNSVYSGVANIGHCPTFDKQELSIEVHLFDFNQDIYDCPILVNFIRRLRGEIKFSTPTALVHQIRKDIQSAHKTLSYG
jgi:riboflavin kinase/FMN adenylyltransferase